MSRPHTPDGYISYGPNANCTLSTCPVQVSVYEYQPSLAANVTMLVLFAVSGLLHIYQGTRYRSWWYMSAMITGCVSEIVGYIGRIGLHYNPFSFANFIMQIVTITFAPVFFAAAIYVTLAQTINMLGPEYSRFRPSLFYWVFISCDLVSLVLQAVGGSMSSDSSGSSQVGVDTALAGLSFQVITLFVFSVLSADYAIRWYRGSSGQVKLTRRFKQFVFFTAAAIIFIFIRCAYRIDELSQGYSGPLISNQGLFIALEGVMVVCAAYCLNIGHPGPVVYQRKESVIPNEKRLSGTMSGSEDETGSVVNPNKRSVPSDERV